MSTDWNAMIPTLQDTWIGNVADPLDVALTKGSDDLLISYISFLWPDFCEHEGMVLLGTMDTEYKASVDNWLRSLDGSKSAVERMLNHRHLLDVHAVEREPLEVQLRFIGRTCVEMWRAKLRTDFPHLEFDLHFNDEPLLPLFEYQVTFCTVR